MSQDTCSPGGPVWKLSSERYLTQQLLNVEQDDKEKVRWKEITKSRQTTTSWATKAESSSAAREIMRICENKMITITSIIFEKQNDLRIIFIIYDLDSNSFPISTNAFTDSKNPNVKWRLNT